MPINVVSDDSRQTRRNLAVAKARGFPDAQGATHEFGTLVSIQLPPQ